MQPTWDLIIVGAGILGTSHAYFAAKRGWRVLLLERGDWPGEASVRNFGTLMAGSLTGEWRRRGRESIAVYRELAPLAGFNFYPSGSLYPCHYACRGRRPGGVRPNRSRRRLPLRTAGARPRRCVEPAARAASTFAAPFFFPTTRASSRAACFGD